MAPMSQLDVRLLGRPVVLIDGTAVPPPKGAKAWGLLAYLATATHSYPRTELAELLFSEANDPLGALRWNLAALRRLLDRPEALKGDSIRLDLADAVIDTRQLDDLVAGSPIQPEVGQELLAGLSFGDSPIFELWLTGERRRLRRRAASLLREATLRGLARGEHDLAIRTAGALIAMDPLDEGHHALLIRAHTLGGDAAGARHHYEQCRALLRTELATEPGAAVLAAVHLAGPADESGSVDLRAIDARMTVAWQSFLGGAVDYGLDLGRSVVSMAERGDDVKLQITTRLFLAAMLSIAVRGWDESATITTEVLHMSEGAGLPFEEAMAHGVLAGIELMRADYRAARQHASAGAARCEEAGALAFNLTFLSAVEADVGEGAQAVLHATEAVSVAAETADPIRIVYASAYAGHALLLEGDPTAARPYVERAIEATASMLVLQPWPMAMLAEIEVVEGNLDAALEAATRAAALAATTDVAYQRALAQRAIALVEAARGDEGAAIDRLTDALAQARRTTGEGYTFHWPVAWILESLSAISALTDPTASRRWAMTLLDHAATVGMHGFVERAEHLLDLTS